MKRNPTLAVMDEKEVSRITRNHVIAVLALAGVGVALGSVIFGLIVFSRAELLVGILCVILQISFMGLPLWLAAASDTAEDTAKKLRRQQQHA